MGPENKEPQMEYLGFFIIFKMKKIKLFSRAIKSCFLFIYFTFSMCSNSLNHLCIEKRLILTAMLVKTSRILMPIQHRRRFTFKHWILCRDNCGFPSTCFTIPEI